jgi:hypothetical protein
LAEDCPELLARWPYGPAVAVEIGSLSTEGYPGRLSIAGNLAFVSAASAGLRIIDIETPVSPVEVGSLDTPGPASGIASNGVFAFVVNGFP